jgi:hypothetical protein
MPAGHLFKIIFEYGTAITGALILSCAVIAITAIAMLVVGWWIILAIRELF